MSYSLKEFENNFINRFNALPVIISHSTCSIYQKSHK